MTAVGIVGHEAAKFTPSQVLEARQRIDEIVVAAGDGRDVIIVSGHCHLGGVDI